MPATIAIACISVTVAICRCILDTVALLGTFKHANGRVRAVRGNLSSLNDIVVLAQQHLEALTEPLSATQSAALASTETLLRNVEK